MQFLLRISIALLIVIWSSPEVRAVNKLAGETSVRYKVIISAPSKVRHLLVDQLDLVAFSKLKNKYLTHDQLQFLLAQTPQKIRELVLTEGYLSPLVQMHTREFKGGLRRIIHITVRPGAQMTVSKVEMEFAGEIRKYPKRIAQIRNRWPLKKGTAFSQTYWAAAKTDTLDLLKSRDYFGAAIATSEAKIHAQSNLVELYIKFDSGPAFTFGQLTVVGQKRYPEWIVHNINPIRPGTPASTQSLLTLQKKIQSTEYYSSVSIDVDSDVQHHQNAQITATVNENPFYDFRSGLGYTSDSGFRVPLAYRSNHFLQKPWVLDAKGQWIQNKQYGVNLQISPPPTVQGYRNSGSVGISSKEENGIRDEILNLSLTQTRSKAERDVSYSLSYLRNRSTRLHLSEETLNRALLAQITWTWQDIDDLVLPREGNSIFLSTSTAAQNLLSDRTFARVYGSLRHYIAIGTRDLAMVRLELGEVFTDGDGSSKGVPDPLLFLAGGGSSIRGYRYNSIGIQQGDGGEILPAKSIFTASIEYQHWLSNRWGAAAFFDIGNASNDLLNSPLFPGFGAGLRFRTPVGLINLDLAYGVKTERFLPFISFGIAF